MIQLIDTNNGLLMLVRCNRCKGGKQVQGMGMILEDCEECNAEGWITVEKAIAKDVQDDEKKGSTKSSKSNKKSSKESI
jgi:hypothetical protein